MEGRVLTNGTVSHSEDTSHSTQAKNPVSLHREKSLKLVMKRLSDPFLKPVRNSNKDIKL